MACAQKLPFEMLPLVNLLPRFLADRMLRLSTDLLGRAGCQIATYAKSPTSGTC